MLSQGLFYSPLCTTWYGDLEFECTTANFGDNDSEFSNIFAMNLQKFNKIFSEKRDVFRHVDFATKNMEFTLPYKVDWLSGRSILDYDLSPAQSFDVTRNHLDFEET